ncbi:flagellar hook-basal body complex protein [Legionella dresdenensis]|uniref:Flagellar hook-basal body complex protein n=1 Tax=Legionella dresdenensis TaxID=450200 RepID=A0ABV8CH89_9GAMM
MSSSTYYTSLSGMLAASYGLQNCSNNVANMDNAGYKRSDVFYSALGQGDNPYGLGGGVTIGGKSVNFSAGNYQETGNVSDLAIVGNGFFIVRLPNGELQYTRNGSFGFNNDGLMIEKRSGGLVQGYDKNGCLVPLSNKGPEICSGKATNYVQLKGELAFEANPEYKPDEQTSDEGPYTAITFTVGNIFDSQGNANSVTVTLTSPKLPTGNSGNVDIPGALPTNADTWNVEIKSSDGKILETDTRTIQFTINSEMGIPDKINNKILFSLNGEQVELNFGSPENDVNNSLRLYKKTPTEHTMTTVNTVKQNGYKMGKQNDFSINDDGLLIYHYDNGQKLNGIHLALAGFDDMANNLVQTDNNMFRAKSDSGRYIGRANQHALGAIQSKKLESSNVDSTTEFANIVVLQRMFQACSQIMDIDKQLLEELEKK